jgi:hypothetical protein
VFIYLNDSITPVLLPEVEAERITRELLSVKHSRNLASRATRDFRNHGASGWGKTRRQWTRCGDNCETWSLASINAASARAAAELAEADVACADHMALLAEDAMLHARAADPLAYCTGFGYIS